MTPMLRLQSTLAQLELLPTVLLGPMIQTLTATHLEPTMQVVMSAALQLIQ